MNRRDFIETSSSCAAHLWVLGAAMPPSARALFAARQQGPALAREPWDLRGTP